MVIFGEISVVMVTVSSGNYNLVWYNLRLTKKSMCKLLGWLGGLNVTSVPVDPISLGILRCRLPTSIVVAGHVLLGLSKCGLCF